MSSKTASARPGHDRASLYDEITGKIIAELEAGRVPWVQPWGTAAAKAPLAMPKNAATGRQYSGINVLILWGAVIEHGFPAQSWLTFRQALSLGGNVRKGEHVTTVVYADRFVPDDEKRRARETGEEAAAIPFLKRFTVFPSDNHFVRLSIVEKCFRTAARSTGNGWIAGHATGGAMARTEGEGLPPDRRQGRRHTPICGETPQRPLCSIKLNRRRHRTFLDEAHGGIRAVRFRSQPAAGSRLPIESESSAGSAVTG